MGPSPGGFLGRLWDPRTPLTEKEMESSRRGERRVGWSRERHLWSLQIIIIIGLIIKLLVWLLKKELFVWYAGRQLQILCIKD